MFDITLVPVRYHLVCSSSLIPNTDGLSALAWHGFAQQQHTPIGRQLSASSCISRYAASSHLPRDAHASSLPRLLPPGARAPPPQSQSSVVGRLTRALAEVQLRAPLETREAPLGTRSRAQAKASPRVPLAWADIYVRAIRVYLNIIMYILKYRGSLASRYLSSP